MSIFNKSFLKDLFFSAEQRDLLLGDLLQSLKTEGPSQNTCKVIILLAQKYPNDQGIEDCLSHTISYVDAFYGPRAAYAITQELSSGRGAYNRVRNMAVRRAPTLVFEMSLEPIFTEPIFTQHKLDVMTTSQQAVSICEKFMKGRVTDSIVSPSERDAKIKPIECREFFYSLKY